jgi:hypothetical protein
MSFTAVQVPRMSALEMRKGAIRAADIPTKVLEGLNAGTLESVNLTEWLAVDGLKLLTVLLPTWKLKRAADVLEVAQEVVGLGVMQRTERLALALCGERQSRSVGETSFGHGALLGGLHRREPCSPSQYGRF